MTDLPQIETDRLLLRPFRLEDARRVQQLAGDRSVAATTLNIPYPYEDGVAENWIRSHPENFAKRESATFAVTLKSEADDIALMGAIGLTLAMPHARGEMGYWIGKPYWGRGYCTEAARAVLDFGFVELGLQRIFARHMDSNPASGRIMEKIGMQYEGCLRQHVNKWGQSVNINLYGILRSEYLAPRSEG
jgi:RimJ/RimL family protein N-acetyltransferase